ncbi:MAG: transposase [Clostridia bacterium]
MTIRADFEHVSALQYKLRAFQHRIDELESGEAYTELESKLCAAEKRHLAKTRHLEGELGRSERLNAKMRKRWFEVFETVERECNEKVGRAESQTKRMQERTWRAECALDAARDASSAQAGLMRELEQRLAEAEGMIAKLTAQVNRDFENSSLPSSAQGPARKRVPNTRASSGLRPGAQTGHPHHPRKCPKATRIVDIADPEDYERNPDLYRTGNVLSKLLISAHVAVDVIEYQASEWRRRSNGARLHTPFPQGLRDEVTYDGSVKTLAFLLANECCTSAGKVKCFLREASGGVLDVSTGMINGLAREFSLKSEAEKAQAVQALMSASVMHADFTGANVGGQNKQVLILAGGSRTMMLARESKGHKGIKGTPLENYVGCAVHDHDKTFYSYGLTHQECMQHNIRYLTGSVQNEPDLTWSTGMLDLIREMLHWRKQQPPETVPDPDAIAEFERRYDEHLELATTEYKNNPPTKYCRDGYNLSVRLQSYRESELRFLHDMQVPPDNSLCERLARVFKRKMHQAIVFRSFESLSYICDAIGKINDMRTLGKDVFAETNVVFDRAMPTA